MDRPTVSCGTWMAMTLASAFVVASADAAMPGTVELPIAGHLAHRCDIALASGEGSVTHSGDSVTTLVVVTCNYPGASEVEVVGPTLDHMGADPGTTQLTLLQLVTAEGRTRLTFELVATAGSPAQDTQPSTADGEAPRARLFGQRRGTVAGTAILTPN